ncbi:MAG: 30S ribosomal protein S4 [Dehalococcoidia bacterium]|nr:30S ribosomal protein S4 [Dehalococcoidia bacterium]
MARYNGPTCRKCRRFGEKLFLKGERCLMSKCACERRMYPPGQSRTARRRKLSEWGQQLMEKQKARVVYGVLERQFRHHLEQAGKLPGLTGENLLQVLERRLDNVIFRLGLGQSRRQARQLALHGHFLINGRMARTPSILLSEGDEIAVSQKSRSLDFFKEAARELKGKSIPGWLSLDPENMKGRVQALPGRGDIDAKISEQDIVEHYSR